MQLIDILARDRVVADLRVSSKKRLLEQLADLLSADHDAGGLQRTEYKSND